MDFFDYFSTFIVMTLIAIPAFTGHLESEESKVGAI
jgi:hypothetical protein